MNLMLLGLLVSFAGVILMILGKLWAVLLFLVGFCLIVAHWARLYKGAGYEADVNPGNGLAECRSLFRIERKIDLVSGKHYDIRHDAINLLYGLVKET